MNPAYLAQLERAHLKAARIVAIDPRALPVFERIDRELEATRLAVSASRADDPIAAARAMLKAQRAGALQ